MSDRELRALIERVLDAHGATVSDPQLVKDLVGIAKSERRSVGSAPPRAASPPQADPALLNHIEWYLCDQQKAGDAKARGLWERLCNVLDSRRERTQADYDRERESQMAPAEPLTDLLREFSAQQAEWDLWKSDPRQAFENLAAEFYRETGLLVPGKSVPLEMANADDDALRRQRYTEWSEARRVRRQAMLRRVEQALAEHATQQAALRDLIEQWRFNAENLTASYEVGVNECADELARLLGEPHEGSK